MSTGRLETFADGVFAIAATLLILNVDTRVGEEVADLGERLLVIWPSYVGYVVSFVTIGIIWINHHTFMAQIGKVDRLFLLLNVGLLLCVAFIPFPTRLVTEQFRSEGAPGGGAGVRRHADGDRRVLQRDLVLRVGRRPPAPRRPRPEDGERHHAELPPGAVDLPRGDPGRVREPDGERRPVRRGRGVLRRGELVVRQVSTEELSRVRYITSKVS